jgi:hypothetical protein
LSAQSIDSLRVRTEKLAQAFRKSRFVFGLAFPNDERPPAEPFDRGKLLEISRLVASKLQTPKAEV